MVLGIALSMASVCVTVLECWNVIAMSHFQPILIVAFTDGREVTDWDSRSASRHLTMSYFVSNIK